MFIGEERGQSLVEFAASVLLLALILAGVLDLGRGFYSYVVITNAAREGARFGASYPDYEDVIRAKVIAEAADSGITLTAGDVSVSLTGPNPKGFPVRVDVHYEFEPLLGGIFGLFGAPLEIVGLNSSARMIVM